ncbi:MAG: hypothetical protein ACRCS9_08245 [Hyphomicrobium sp.]
MSYGAIEMSLVFGSVLVLAIYELVSVRRSMKADADALKDQDRKDGAHDPS